MAFLATNPLLPDNTGGVFKSVDVSTTVDNVYVFTLSDGNKYKYQTDGVYRIGMNVKRTGVTGDLTSLVNNVLATMVENELVIDCPVRIDGTLTVPAGKVLEFKKGGQLTGVGSMANISEKNIEAGLYKIFADSFIVSIASGAVVQPEWFGADAANTDNQPYFQKIANAVFNLGGATVHLNTFYNIQAPMIERNAAIHYKGEQRSPNGGGSGFNITGCETTITASPVLYQKAFNVNSKSLFESPIGYTTITITGVSTGTEIFYTYNHVDPVSGRVSTSRTGSFIYNGADSVVAGLRLSETDCGEFVFASTASAVVSAGITGLYNTRITNRLSNNITSLKTGDLQLLSSTLTANTNVIVQNGYYGVIPPYSVKVTLTGVTVGATVVCQVWYSDTQQLTNTFTYAGPDTVAITGVVPSKDETKPRTIITFSPASMGTSPFNSFWCQYWFPTSFYNNISGATITDVKFNNVSQFTRPRWNGKSLFDTSGGEFRTMEDVNINCQPRKNPMEIPFAGIYSWVDATFPYSSGSFSTQRENRLIRVKFDRWNYDSEAAGGDAGDWGKARGMFANVAIDGPALNNDFFTYDECRFYYGRYNYYNNTIQSVEHRLSNCTFGISDWAVSTRVGVQMYSPFYEFGNSAGMFLFAGSAGEFGHSVIERFTTEAIHGYNFAYFPSGMKGMVEFQSAQPAFGNRFSGTLNPWLVNGIAFDTNEIHFDRLDGIFQQQGQPGAVTYVGINIPTLPNSHNVKFSITNLIASTGTGLALRLFKGSTSSFLFQFSSCIASTQSANYSQQILRIPINQFSDVWNGQPFLNVSDLIDYNNTNTQRWGSGTESVDFGKSIIGANMAIGVTTQRYVVPAGIYRKVILPGVIPAGKVLGIGISNLEQHPVQAFGGGVWDVVGMYVGEKYDYKKFGYIHTQGNNSSNPTSNNTSVYDTVEDLILTPVVRADLYNNASISFGYPVVGIALDGTVTFNIAATGSWMVGRHLRLIEGPFSGAIGKILSVTNTTTIVTDFNLGTIIVDTKFEIFSTFTGAPFYVNVYKETPNKNFNDSDANVSGLVQALTTQTVNNLDFPTITNFTKGQTYLKYYGFDKYLTSYTSAGGGTGTGLSDSFLPATYSGAAYIINSSDSGTGFNTSAINEGSAGWEVGFYINPSNIIVIEGGSVTQTLATNTSRFIGIFREPTGNQFKIKTSNDEVTWTQIGTTLTYTSAAKLYINITAAAGSKIVYSPRGINTTSL